MATLSSTGIGSGLDVNGIVSQLMALERKPQQLLAQARSGLDAQLSAVGKMQSLVSTMRDASSNLAALSLWSRATATSQTPDAVAVSTSGAAANGSYSVGVQALASMQTLASRSFASAAAELGEGTLTIELGNWTTSPAGFAPKSGATPVTISFGAGETSLAEVRDRINAADAGVTASIVNDANGARLALRSTATGAENGFKISVTETLDDGIDADGLSALSYATFGGPSTMSRTQLAGNAKATVNGIEVESATNTLTGVAEGLNLRLLKTTDGPVEVTVAQDTAAVRDGVNAFVKSFNDLMSFIRDQTRYDAASKVGGALQGDRLTTQLQSQLRSVLNQPSSASSVFGRLSDVGITMQTDGKLAVNAAKLEVGLGNLPELKKLLRNDGAASGDSGFVDRFKDLGEALLKGGGAFETRSASLRDRVTRNTRNQESQERRLALTESRLRTQYQTLDTRMGQLSSLSGYMSQQLAMLNGNNSNSR